MDDYSKTIRNFLGPKLAYYGFKYNDKGSHPATGLYQFTRSYWGKSQYISIGRVQYDLKEISELIAEDDDIPTEVPEEQMLIQEHGYRLWLSNRYIHVVIGHESGGIDVTHTGLGIPDEFKRLADVPFDKAQPALRELKKRYLWWQCPRESELLQVLQRIARIVITDGLDWLEEQVAEIRRYQERLDGRQQVQ
jgi:hypothetical protein